jgi:hypothetical protein
LTGVDHSKAERTLDGVKLLDNFFAFVRKVVKPIDKPEPSSEVPLHVRDRPRSALATSVTNNNSGHVGHKAIQRHGPMRATLILTKKHEPKGLLAVQANYIRHTARLMHVPLMLVLKLPLFL